MIRRCLIASLLACNLVSSAGETGLQCARTYSPALHEHGLLYAMATDSGTDKDVADELIHRSGCKVVESGALDEKRIRRVSSIAEFNDPSVLQGLIMSKAALSPGEQAKWQVWPGEMRNVRSIRHIFEKYFQPEMAVSTVNFLEVW